ncbi:MAG TPA: hypothetical protein VN889_02805 [Solirubrobacteraceae bacterium]|nr:hypothetical protein [Solirubrobacteraceae bacterium]
MSIVYERDLTVAVCLDRSRSPRECCTLLVTSRAEADARCR